MKQIIAGLIVLFLSTGCDTGSLGGSEEIATEVAATDGSVVENIFTSSCKPVKKLYYPDEDSLASYFIDISGVEMFWDTRYTIDQAAYICDPNMKFSTIVDTRTSTHSFYFGGPQSTLIYSPKVKPYAWKNGGNLMMQAEMTSMSYENFDTNLGGNIAFNLFIVNTKTAERINYVISMYTLNKAWSVEKADVLFDPSTNTSFVSTIIAPGTKYTTMSAISGKTNGELGLFRVNISSENLKAALDGAGLSSVNLNDWHLNFIGIQFELEEDGGDGKLTGSFNSFEAYMTTSPM